MTAYVANHRKKINIFEKRETELRHALKHNFSSEKIASIAEKVRTAKLNVFKAKYAKSTVLPASSYIPEGEALEWQNLSTDEIIQKYVQIKT